jgi:hypothetical protein
MMKRRELRVPAIAVGADQAVLRRLVSQNVLVETRERGLQFSHQTLLDAVAVRAALAAGQTLLEFILSVPPFPFVRPAVRSFVAHLRALQPDAFERQVRATMDSGDVAYHLKRAILESLADLSVTRQDWTLVRFLWKTHPGLFRRCLARIERDSWFDLLRDEWWSALSASEPDRACRLEFLSLLERWMNTRTQHVIRMWREALSDPTAAPQIRWRVSHALQKFTKWSDDGVADLVKAVAGEDKEEYSQAGSVLSRFVDETGYGDELLWAYVTRCVDSSRAGETLEKLRCEDHHFHRPGFIGDRLKRSDHLLDLALGAILEWSPDEGRELLWCTSWVATHTKGLGRQRSGLAPLLKGVEEALLSRARVGAPWWLEREESLRQTTSWAVRYILLRAYRERPEECHAGIAAQLLDRQLLRNHDLEFEVGELIQTTYPYLAPDAQEAHERLVLSLYADAEAEERPWARQAVCTLLLRIPASMRSSRAQEFLDRWAPRALGAAEPRIYTSGGWVSPPVPDEILVGLSQESIWRLLDYYERSPEGEAWRDHTGGLEHFCNELAEAAARAPQRFLAMFKYMWRGGVYPGAMRAVVRGVGNHLLYRYGNLQRPQGVKLDEEPLPDGHALAQELMDILESCSVVWREPSSAREVLEACAHLAVDEGTADRIVWLALQLMRVDEASSDEDQLRHNAPEPMHDAFNTSAGVATTAVTIVAGNLLEAGKPLTPLLKWCLHRSAAHPRSGVRAALLNRFPFILHKDPELGWRLLTALYADAVPALWELGEASLGPRLRDSFDRVRPFLDRMAIEAPSEAGEAWGRLSMLAVLHSKLTLDEVFTVLATVSAEPMWKGVIQVLAANAGDPESASTCQDGFVRILREVGSIPEGVLTEIDHEMLRSAQASDIGFEVANLLVDALPAGFAMSKLHGLLKWLPNATRRDPGSALPLVEKIARKLTSSDAREIYDDTSLTSAVLELLREADASDDPELISRVIVLQDRLLEAQYPGMERMLDEATERIT